MNTTNTISNTPTSGSLFARLRALVPQRPLSFGEALRITELQANRCRELLGFRGPAFPEGAIADLPRVRLIEVDNLPSSAVSQWHNGCWTIAVDAAEPWQRQRVSAGHELWHIINHTTGQWLHAADQRRAEQLADYFSGCLYMPKQHLKRLVGEGLTTPRLAETVKVIQKYRQILTLMPLL